MLAFVTALHAEAASLIDHYGLKQDRSFHSFRLFRNDSVSLIISGVGKVRAAIATALLLQSLKEDAALIAVNVGCVGSLRRFSYSDHVLVHSIVDAASGRGFFPDMALRHNLPEGSLITVDKPCREATAAALVFKQDLVDMEASGFYEAAALLLPPSRIVCFKTVSDRANGEFPSSRALQTLISTSIPTVTEYLARLTALLLPASPILNEVEQARLEQISTSCKFTASLRSTLISKCMAFKLRGHDLSSIFASFGSPSSTPSTPRDKQQSKEIHRKLVAGLDA